MTPQQRIAALQEMVENRQRLAQVEQQIATMEEMPPVPTAPTRILTTYVSAAGLAPTRVQAQPPHVPSTGGAATLTAPTSLRPPYRGAPPTVFTPADFPRAPNAQAVPYSPTPVLSGASVKELTSADAVRSGQYGANRAQLLAMVGPQQRDAYGFVQSGLIATGAPVDLPAAQHPVVAHVPLRPHRSSSPIEQPHGHPSNLGAAPLAQAKVARARLLRQARGR